MALSRITADPNELLVLAAQGDRDALSILFDGHRERLKRMVALRIDPRLSARVDPSDIVQEALIDASRKLKEYARDRPLPFYPWLHRLTSERLASVHRQHVQTQSKSVGREEPRHSPLAGHSIELLADRLAANDPTPGTCLIREERQLRLLSAMEGLDETDRTLLMMRYLEDLSFPEIAAILEIGESAAKMRHLRALQRLRDRIGTYGLGSSL